MTTTPNNRASHGMRIRLWPGVVLAIVAVIARYIVPVIAPDAELFSFPLPIIGILGGMLVAVLIFVWWLFFSRAPWLERLGALALMVVAIFATSRVVDKSIAGGMMGNLLTVYSVPLLGVALVAWAAATRRFGDRARRVWLVVAIVLACVPWTLLRTAGSLGAGSEFHWRWTPTPEDRLLARADEVKVVPPPAPVETPKEPETPKQPVETKVEVPRAAAAEKPAPPAPAAIETPAEWPGFRGPDRDSIIHGVRINPDWSASPPVEMWRRPIGPGWSSFAVRGDLLYTQEQRGDDEIVACYRVSTGEPVWRHRDPVRFWESNGGAGPRGTPTLSNGRVYAFGATGILNALDAATGKLLWSHNVSTDASRRVPDWGFSSSPLVIDDLVIVAASGTLAAYDAAAGHKRWVGRRLLGSYSSPHRATIDGVEQVLMLTGSGAASFAPATGEVLWEHKWDSGGGPTIVQPALTADGDVLVNGMVSTGGTGTKRLVVKHRSEGWNVEERWTSNGLKPYFNDFVVHKGHAYGFDGSILACIDLQDGTRKWKGGRYGNGQLVLLPEQDLLLVLAEEGELVLVSATTDQFKELARVPGLNGKTWNHPVVVGNILLARNGEEMVAFRLAPSRPESD